MIDGKNQTGRIFIHLVEGRSRSTSHHVFDGKNRLLGRVALPDYKPLDDWSPPRKVVEILNSLQAEGRL
ncbi:MAG: hypothetical protein ACR2ID_11630 [Chthoniobacterales bacterium]